MFTVSIRWGSSEPTEPVDYSFATKEELAAFVTGVDEASGWMEYEIVSETPDEGFDMSDPADAADAWMQLENER